MRGCVHGPFNATAAMCAAFVCNTTNDTPPQVSCAGDNMAVHTITGLITGHACQTRSLKFKDRFGHAIVVSTSPSDASSGCDLDVDQLLFYPGGMIDEWNPYEGLHQHITGYAAMRNSGDTGIPTTVVFSNPIPTSRGYPLQGLWTQTFQAVLTPPHLPRVICAKRLIISPSSEYSLISYHNDACHHRQLASAYAHWLLTRFAIDPRIATRREPSVLFVGRPEKLRRHETNGAAFGKALCDIYTECEWVEGMHRLSMKTQISLVANTDILVATHGAQLTWMVVQPTCAQVVEIYPQPHYRHMAAMFGHGYHGVRAPISWGTSRYAVDIQKTLAGVQKAKKAWETCISPRK